MALQVSQGTLPFDSSVVDPATFLEAWVAGTSIWNFGPEMFAGGTLQFVISQTDEPAAALKTPGLLWYKRGEGRLFMWDKPDLPSALTFSDANWLCLSDRKEVWVYAYSNIAKGAPCTFIDVAAGAQNSNITGLITNTANNAQLSQPVRPIWTVSSLSNGSGATNKYCEVVFVANDTGMSGSLIRATELGFCDGLFISGATGAAGAVVIDDNVPGWFGRIDPTCGSACRYMPIAECGESYADPVTEGTRPIFKHMMPLVGIASAAGV